MLLKLPVISNSNDFKAHFNDPAWNRLAAEICARHRLAYTVLRRASQGENIIFLVDERLVIKIYTPFRDGYARETAALEFAAGKLGIEIPSILHAGEIKGWRYLVITQLKGLAMKDVWSQIEPSEKIEIVSCLGRALKNLHKHPPPLSSPALNRDWHGFINRQARLSVDRQRSCHANPEWLESLPEFIETGIKRLPANFSQMFLHGDVHPMNVLLAHAKGRWRISGLFDFGDSLCGFHEYEFVAPGVLMVQGNRELQRALLLAYGYREAELDLDLRARLMLLTVLYECSDLRKYALRLAPEAVNFTLAELESAIWTFAD